MKFSKAILFTAVAAIAADAIIPNDYKAVSLTQLIAASQPTQPTMPVQQEHDHQPTGGEGSTTIVIGSQTSGTNTTATTVKWL